MIPHILLLETILHLSKLLNNFLIRIEAATMLMENI